MSNGLAVASRGFSASLLLYRSNLSISCGLPFIGKSLRPRTPIGHCPRPIHSDVLRSRPVPLFARGVIAPEAPVADHYPDRTAVVHQSPDHLLARLAPAGRRPFGGAVADCAGQACPSIRQ